MPTTRPINRSPAVTPAIRPTTRPAVRPTPVRPRPVVRPAKPLPRPPASIRTGTVAARQTAIRTSTRTAFRRTTVAATGARAARLTRRVAYGAAIRTALRPRCAVVFSPNWWNARRHLWYRHHWHYCHRHRPYYWWRWATWATVSTWVVYDYQDPWTYEYDDNVLIEDEAVYINEEPVAAADDYIAIADELAAIDAPADDAEIEWLSLGAYAMSTSEDDKDPQMMVQLVLAKDGRVAGTYYHFQSQNLFPIQGSLDGETQRIAFSIGDQRKNVIEVGLSSLTEDEAPMWVHFDGGNRTQTWTLVRLEEPEWAEEAAATGDGATDPPSAQN